MGTNKHSSTRTSEPFDISEITFSETGAAPRAKPQEKQEPRPLDELAVIDENGEMTIEGFRLNHAEVNLMAWFVVAGVMSENGLEPESPYRKFENAPYCRFKLRKLGLIEWIGNTFRCLNKDVAIACYDQAMAMR